MQGKKRFLSLIVVLILCLGTVFTAVGCGPREAISVWFDGNGGELVSGKVTQQVYSTSEIVPPVFSKEHYEFVGWDKDLSKIKNHTTVNALWKERYFLTFEGLGTDATISVYPDQAIGTLPIPTQETSDKRFIGWTLDGQKINDQTVWTWDDDKQAMALWCAADEFTLDLWYQGGKVEVPNKIIYKSSDETFTLNNPTKKGYEFIGWTIDGDESGQLYMEIVIEKGSTGDRKYIANWKANEYQITFNAQSGVVETLTKTVTYGEEIGELPVPYNGSVEFLGWYYGDKKIEETTGYRQAEDIELVAKWQYTITFQLWTTPHEGLTINATVVGGNPKDIVVDSDYVVNTDFPPAERVRLDVGSDVATFYGWVVGNKKFDGTDLHYPVDTTVEQMMMSLKKGNTKEKELRKKIIATGVITVIAFGRTVWTGAH